MDEPKFEFPEHLLHLQRSLTFLANVFSLNSNEGQAERRRFWDNILSCNEDPTQNRDLLSGYLETTARGHRECAESLEKTRRENKHGENILFYELELDTRTRPICAVYGMMSNLLLHLESAVALDSNHRSMEYRIGLEYMLHYMRSYWSFFLPQKRLSLLQRIKNMRHQLLASESIRSLDWDIDENPATISSPCLLVPSQSEPCESSTTEAIAPVTVCPIEDTHNEGQIEDNLVTNNEGQIEDNLVTNNERQIEDNLVTNNERQIEECAIDAIESGAIEEELFPSFNDTEVGADLCDRDLKINESAGRTKMTDQMDGQRGNRSDRPPNARRRKARDANVSTKDDEKKEQELLTTSIGETATRLRHLAVQSRGVIIKDKQRLLESTVVQDNYLHETKHAYALSSQLAWSGSLSFLQELFMVAIAVGLFLLTLSVIPSTLFIA